MTRKEYKEFLKRLGKIENCYGLYIYERTAHDLAKSIALLENSCKLLNLSNGF